MEYDGLQAYNPSCEGWSQIKDQNMLSRKQFVCLPNIC